MADKDDQPAFAPDTGVGSRLKAARESAGQSLPQMAAQTKIPVRMLELLEAGNFAALPARTYATGFTRTYARALGLDEQAMVASVRAELGMQERKETKVIAAFEPGDPARVPSAQFAWVAALAALVILAAGLFLWRTYYAPAVALPALVPEGAATAAPSMAVPTAAPEMIEPTALPGYAATAMPAVPVVPPGPAAAPLRSPAGPRAERSAPAALPSPALERPAAEAAPAPQSTVQN